MPEALPDSQSFLYRIDAEDRIVHVNAAWLSFAKENDYAAAHEAVMGEKIWSFITDVATQSLYGIVLDKVRRDSVRISLPYRCDSPTVRRFMQLDMFPGPDREVEFQSRIVRLEQRPEAVLYTAPERSDELIRMCGWCKKVETDAGVWVEVEEAIDALHLFDEPKLPQITHGICPPCQESVLSAIRDA